MAAASTAVVETRRFAGPLGALVGAVQLYLALRRGRQVRSRRRRIVLAQLLQEGDFFPIPVHIARQDFYLNVVPRMTPERFRRRFRMCRACFDILVTQLAATPELCHLRGYIQPLLDMRKGIMIVLYRLSTLATVVDIAENWGVTESTVVVWTQRVTRAIAVHLGPLLIAWPNYLRREKSSTPCCKPVDYLLAPSDAWMAATFPWQSFLRQLNTRTSTERGFIR